MTSLICFLELLKLFYMDETNIKKMVFRKDLFSRILHRLGRYLHSVCCVQY